MSSAAHSLPSGFLLTQMELSNQPNDDLELLDDASAFEGLTPEEREALSARERRWRRERMKSDLAEAQRRLDIASHLLADALLFFQDDTDAD